MATRSTIAVQLDDGTVAKVYCHWDGYLSHNGVILQEYYNTLDKAAQLVSLGDISSLRPTVGVKHAFSRLDNGMSQEEYDRLYGDMTTYYGRDREEEGTQGKIYKSVEDYKLNVHLEEYDYLFVSDLFNGGQWFVRYYKTGSEYVPLAKELEGVESLA